MIVDLRTFRAAAFVALFAVLGVVMAGCDGPSPMSDPGTVVPGPTQNPDSDPTPPDDPDPTVQVSACGLFAPECVSTIGGSPFATRAADLDGDGDLDLAVANVFADNLSLVLNDGTGRFTETGKIPVGQNPLGLIANDVDSDTDADLLVLNAADSSILLLRNDGAGAFDPDPLIQAGDGSTVFTAADVDNDGDDDLVLGNITTTLNVDQSGKLITLRNDGTGKYEVASTTPIGPFPIDIVATDLDADGDLDVAVVDQGNLTFNVIRNDGTGVFATPESLELDVIPLSMAAGDLDGDGDQDIVVTNFGDLFDPLDNGNVVLLLNDGAGNFGEMRTLIAGAVPYFPAIVDLDADGDLDLAVANDGSDDVSVFLNDGAGNFTLSQSLSVGDGPEFIAVGDFDADGDPDLAVTAFRGGGVAILLNNGDGTFVQNP